MSTVDELFAYAAILCVLQNKKLKRKLWTKQWLERRNHFTHIDLHKKLTCFVKDWCNYLRISGTVKYSYAVHKKPRYSHEKSDHTQ
jgi:hypothetical protein